MVEFKQWKCHRICSKMSTRWPSSTLATRWNIYFWLQITKRKKKKKEDNNTTNSEWNYTTYPNSEPKKPLVVVNFFSASARSCNAFCSLSAIITLFYLKLFTFWNVGNYWKSQKNILYLLWIRKELMCLAHTQTHTQQQSHRQISFLTIFILPRMRWRLLWRDEKTELKVFFLLIVFGSIFSSRFCYTHAHKHTANVGWVFFFFFLTDYRTVNVVAGLHGSYDTFVILYEYWIDTWLRRNKK